MNILFLEDRGSVSFYLQQLLNDRNYNVFEAYSVLDAQSFWENETIDCIILDLNLSPDGLSIEESNRTLNGLLTGWIWLHEYILPKNQEIKKRTIIYSDYLDDLKSAVNSILLSDFALFDKSSSSTSRLIVKLEEIKKSL